MGGDKDILRVSETVGSARINLLDDDVTTATNPAEMIRK